MKPVDFVNTINTYMKGHSIIQTADGNSTVEVDDHHGRVLKIILHHKFDDTLTITLSNDEHYLIPDENILEKILVMFRLKVHQEIEEWCRENLKEIG